MNKPFKLILFLLSLSQMAAAATYDVTTQTQFDAAISSSAGSTENNTINVNIPGGADISAATSFSGNVPHTLTVNVSGVDVSAATPFDINAPLNVNAEGIVSLVPGTSSVQMNVNSTLTQTGGMVSATNGSTIVIDNAGSYALNGGTLQVGGVNGLSALGGGLFSLGGPVETIQVIDSDLSINMNMSMNGTGAAILDTNGFNAAISGTLTTPVNLGGVPTFNKIGTGNLTLADFTMSGGGEYHIQQGTAAVTGNSVIPYFALGTGAGANAVINLSDSSMNLTIQQTVAGNESANLQVGDFSGICTVNQTAGTIHILDASLNVSNQSGQGVYNLSGGTISVTAVQGVGSVSYVDIGRNNGTHAATTGILNLSGTGLFDIFGTSGNADMILGSRVDSLVGHSDGIVNQTGGILRVRQGGRLFLSGYGNGIYNLTGGILEIGGTSLNATFAGGSGTYQFNVGNGTIKVIESDLSSNVNITLVSGETAVVDTNGFNASFLGSFSGAGALRKISNGILTLAGTNTYFGGSEVLGGVLQGNTASLQGDIVNNASVIFDQSGLGTYAGMMSGTGAMTKQNNGTLILTGANTYSGGTNVLSGVLQGNATSLQGDIVNSTSVIFDQTGTGTYAGMMSGTGSMTKQNNGTLILAGTNFYSGGTSLNGGTLQGNTASLQGNIAVNNTTTLNFDQSFDGTFNGIVTGTSTAILNKINAGKLVFVNDNSGFLGLTNVSGGRLSLNNKLGGNVNVFQTGILSGVGSVLGNVNVDSGGAIAPGNSIGTLSINGNYTQGSGGTYQVEVNSSGQSSLIDINGNASLAGTVKVIPLDGINPSLTYDILHADGGITGVFNTLIAANPILVPRITYTGLDVFLNFGTNFSSIAATRNQNEVALQLNTITNPTASELAIINELITLAGDPATLSLAQLALDQMGGQQYTHSLVISEFASHQFTRRLYDPLRSIITTSPCVCSCEDRCGVDAWLEAGGGRTFFESNREVRGFKTSECEITGGIQKTFNRDKTVGLAGSYDDQKVHYNLKGNSNNQMGFAAIYGLYRPENFYVWGDMAFGCGEQHLRRYIDIGSLHFKAHGKSRIYQGSAYIEAGCDYFLKCVLIQPFLGFELGYARLGHVHEHGANPINLTISSKNRTNVHSNLGLHITAHNALGVNFSLDAAWLCRLTSLDGKISEHFQTFGNQFTIIGAPFSRNSVNGALTVTKQFCDGWECFAEANGERWSRASTYTFLGGLKYSW